MTEKIPENIREEIRQRYLNNEKVSTIILSYQHLKITEKQVRNWVYWYKWDKQKRGLKEKLIKDHEGKISHLTDKMLDSIDKILKDDKSSNGDKIAACRIIADISGLKTSNINDSRKKAVDKDTLEAIEKQLGLNYKANKKA